MSIRCRTITFSRQLYLLAATLMDQEPQQNNQETEKMGFGEEARMFGIFFKIGLTTIGGGYAMIPMMEQEIVTKAKWLNQQEFLNILAVAQATPGIFAVDMASHIGYKLGGVRAAMLAAFANILPSFIIILILAAFFHQYKDIPIIANAFMAIRPVVVALIAAPVFSMARTAKLNRYTFWIPIVCAGLIWLMDVSPVYIILLAGVCGWIYGLMQRRKH